MARGKKHIPPEPEKSCPCSNKEHGPESSFRALCSGSFGLVFLHLLDHYCAWAFIMFGNTYQPCCISMWRSNLSYLAEIETLVDQSQLIKSNLGWQLPSACCRKSAQNWDLIKSLQAMNSMARQQATWALKALLIPSGSCTAHGGIFKCPSSCSNRQLSQEHKYNPVAKVCRS